MPLDITKQSEDKWDQKTKKKWKRRRYGIMNFNGVKLDKRKK